MSDDLKAKRDELAEIDAKIAEVEADTLEVQEMANAQVEGRQLDEHIVRKKARLAQREQELDRALESADATPAPASTTPPPSPPAPSLTPPPDAPKSKDKDGN